MADLTSLDGSFEKTLAGSNAIKDLPSIIQKYMMAGVSNNKLTFTKLFDEEAVIDNGGLVNVVAQLAMLDEKQQSAFLSLSKLDEKVKDTIKDLLQATKQGELFNSKLFEQEASKDNKLSKGVLNEVMQAAGMKDTDGNYLLTNTKDVCDLLEQYANDANNAQKAQELFNAGLLEQSDNGYKVSASLLKLIDAKKSDIVTTGIAAAGQMAWNYAMQIGKQLLLSLGVAAVAFIATKLVDYIMNLKTHSEELVDAMNDSHDAAQQATKDVEEIQSKIDELNKSLKDAGVKKIEDIVDPAERERLQAINDMLQAQLELKKQLEKDANDKANTDTSAVVNDKTEDSIVKSRTVNVSYAEGGANAGTHQVAEKVSKTESLNEHSDYLYQLVQKRREMATAGEEETQAYKDNEVEIEKKKTKIEELSSAVSENMNSYETDADSFVQYKDEYVAGTNAMTAATKALADAQDSTGIDTTNLDIFSEKVKQIKNDIDNGDSQQSDWKTFNGLDAFSGMSGEAIINIDKDSSHQTETETAALEKLHKTADENKISFESLIGVFESFGLVQISNSATADDYADKLEKTMGVIDNIQSAYKACSNAVEEYNKYGYMSVDSLQALLQMDDQYLNTLELVNGKLQVNQSAYADLLATQYAEAQMEAISQATSELNAIAKGDAAEKAETFTEATEDEKNKLTALCPALKDATIGTGELAAALAAAQSAGEGGNADAVQAKIDGVMNALNTRLTLIKTNMQSAMSGASALKNQMNGFDTGKKTQKAASSITDLASAFDTLKEAMNEYNKYGYLSYDTTKSLVGLEDVYTECLTKNNGKLEINTAKLRKFIKTQLEAANASDDGGKSAAEMTKILNWLNSSVDSETISFNQLTDAIKGYGTALDEATGKTDEFQSGMQTLHELFTIDHANGDRIVDYDTLKKVTDLIAKHPEMNGIFLDENGNLNVDDDKIKEAAKVLIQDVITAATDSNQPGLAKLWTDRLAGLTSGNISMTDFWNGFGTDIEDANTKIDKFQSTFSTFRNAYEEIRDTGSLKSQDILQELEKINNLYSWAESGFTDYTDKGFNGLIKTAKKIFGSTGSDGKLNISISTGLKNIGRTVKNAFSGTSGNSITKAFQAGWEAISSGAKRLFSGSSANSLTTIFSNGLSGISDFIGSAFKGLGSTFASGGQILVKAAGSVATKIGSALGIGGGVAAGGATAAGGGVAIAGASAIPVIGAIVAGVVNGINTNIRLIKDQKKIWSSDDKIGTKIVKSVGNTVWRYSPIGMIASTIQNISGFVKKIFGIESKKDKNNGTSSNGKIDVGSIVINSPDSPASNANSGTSGSDTGTTKQSFWDRIKNSKLWFWNWGKRAVGDKGVKHSGMYNVDEQGPELLVRQPASGRYTYLETGDGVVPADITSKLFEMGGNTDKWFADQLSKNGALNNIQNKTIGDTISVGDIYIQNPVGDTDALAREIVRDLPIKLRQQQGRR